MSDMNSGNAGPSWTVTSQTERTIISPAGTPQDIMVVTFTMSDGTQGSVQVPVAGYSVGNVRDAIAAKVATLADIANLGS